MVIKALPQILSLEAVAVLVNFELLSDQRRRWSSTAADAPAKPWIERQIQARPGSRI
jgi:hypothetical protein